MLEQIIFEPLDGAFDAAAVEKRLAAEPFTMRDPTDPKGPFLLCGAADVFQYVRVKLLENPESPYPTVCLVRVAPERVRLSQRAIGDSLRQGRQFAEWFVAHNPCRILDDEGNDYTEACRESLEPLYAA